MAATLPPIHDDPAPLSVWQRIEIVLYVPTSGRCDQHAVEIDGQRVGLLSASQIGVKVREAVRKRPSVEALEDSRRAVLEVYSGAGRLGTNARSSASAAAISSGSSIAGASRTVRVTMKMPQGT